MSCHESARKTALECAGKLEHEARGMAVLRSVDATEAAKWLREIATAIREACGPDEPADPAEPWLAGGASKTEKPSCIPPDCQHYEQLPSGLWAYVIAGAVSMRREDGSGGGSITDIATEEGAAWLSSADFLAARALGVRVLGWAK